MWGVWRWTDGCLELFVVLLGLLAGSFHVWQCSPLGDQFHQELSTPLGCTWQAKVFFRGGFQQNGCHCLSLCCDVVAEWTIICIFAFVLSPWTSTTLTVRLESKMHASPTRVKIRDQTSYNACTWDWELGDSANELALGEGRPVVVLIQHHYLYGGGILESLSAGWQREGFQLHTDKTDKC